MDSDFFLTIRGMQYNWQVLHSRIYKKLLQGLPGASEKINLMRLGKPMTTEQWRLQSRYMFRDPTDDVMVFLNCCGRFDRDLHLLGEISGSELFKRERKLNEWKRHLVPDKPWFFVDVTPSE